VVYWEFTHNVKHRKASLSEEQCQGYEKAMEDFYKMLEENNVNIE